MLFPHRQILRTAVCFVLVAAAAIVGASATDDSATYDLVELQERGVLVGTVTIARQNIFEETPNLSRWRQVVNGLHVVTKESVIRSQLLFSKGQPLNAKAIEESARLLRRNRYLYEANITVDRVSNGVADLTVQTFDTWTLSPELDVSRSGGESFYTLGIEDDNLLGTGASLTLSRTSDIDRVSNLLLYSNNNFLLRRLQFRVGLVDSDDGGAAAFSLVQPFYSLDTRTSWGSQLNYFDATQDYYRDGDDIAEFDRNSRMFNFFRGLSTGRQNGWVRRWVLGIAGEHSDFDPSDDLARRALVPEDRELYYPYIGFSMLEDRFAKTRNFRSIDRIEDIFLGTEYSFSVGAALDELGSDRDALLLSAGTRRSLGSPDNSLVTFNTSLNSRWQSGGLRNFRSSVQLGWNRKQSDHFSFYSALQLTHTERTDLDQLTTLGGSTGLRGYPTRYRNGRGSGLLTIEQRYYSDWYPFKLVRLGGAVFLDVGQVWGRNVLGERNDDLLTDVGVGLRLVSPRGGGKKVIHIDLAFPLNDDNNIDDVQLVIEAKDRF